MNEVIHPYYLPFTRAQLAKHFAAVAGDGRPDRHLDRHLDYYQASADAWATLQAAPPTGAPADVAREVRHGRQMEKDERFWVCGALLTMFYGPNRVTTLASMLSRCLGNVPCIEGLPTWEEALGSDPQLYFEANLPSPPSYRRWLEQHLDERVLVPYVREAAAKRGHRLEGATKVDALLIAPDTGFAVLFEAKVLSDVSCAIGFDAMRNQIVRNIDVMLDANPNLKSPLASRRPDRTYFVLITPEIFKEHRKSRLYGWLYDGYRTDPSLLADHLPHRDSQVDLAAVSSRLGWLTWEDCNRLLPGACPWLGRPNRSYSDFQKPAP